MLVPKEDLDVDKVDVDILCQGIRHEIPVALRVVALEAEERYDTFLH